LGKRYLIDTNILLEYIGNVLPVKATEAINAIIAEDFNISVINRIEVLGHPSAAKEISDFLELTNQYELTQEVVTQTISLRKIYKIKLPDAIIAATAITHNLILVTRNTKDFQNIEGLKTMSPYFPVV
jgi:predicted nucleic acid-binding protein